LRKCAWPSRERAKLQCKCTIVVSGKKSSPLKAYNLCAWIKYLGAFA
jgi:hypothetical protein